MAQLQRRPAAELTMHQSNPGADGAYEYGHYNPETHQISIGSYSLQHDDVKEVVDTTAHEGRHAYQHYAIENPGFHPDARQVEEWRENLTPDNYWRYEDDPVEYANQPVEKDAWRYGRSIARGLYGDYR